MRTGKYAEIHDSQVEEETRFEKNKQIIFNNFIGND